MPKLLSITPPRFTIEIDGKTYSGIFYASADFVDLHLPQGNFRFENPNKKKKRSTSSSHEGGLTAPMPGKVVKILIKEGDGIKKGDVLMILEAMKMEHKITSPRDGVVKKVFFQEGERVSQGADLVEVA
ncbi:MAG: acetyl-CoA carboxylase biotin carboxyl carrier protein subunit [bacterium]